MTLWNEKTAAQAMTGKVTGTFSASRVVIDSRAVQAGDIFVAIQGERLDGHQFVGGAVRQGAVAALVGHEMVVDVPQLISADTLKGLCELGVYNRNRSAAKVVGVTGSVGKTSTKEMLRMALAAHGQTYATSGNYNNHIGTPLNLANLSQTAQFAVFEMGMNHAGEISHLTHMVRPDIAVISNIEAVHLEFFGTLEKIADAKAEIFEGLPEHGVAILNGDQPYMAQFKQKTGAKIISFGANEGNDCSLVSYQATPAGCAITASIFGKKYDYSMQAVGRHWAVISLSVLAVAHALGLDVEKTAAALANFAEVEGRGRVSQVGEFTFINDSYNASPAAMNAAFAKTNEVYKARGEKGRKVAILGDMLELGSTAPQLHADLVEGLVNNGFDAVYTAGNLAKYLFDALPSELRAGHAENAAALRNLIALQPQDVVLVKGSHGSKIYELADALIGGK